MNPAARQLPLPGPNRTVPTDEDRDEMMRGTREFPPTSSGSAEDVAEIRVGYAIEGQPVGHIPEKGLDPSDLQLAQLVDKIGERLAFERSGVRLYDGIISKHTAYGSFEGGPTTAELNHMRDEELQHMHLLARVLFDLGGDPTAVTPSAGVAATASRGVADVIVDPRTTLLQSLEALIIAELSDNECWETLAELTEIAGFEDVAKEFREAHEEEQEHLESVRSWLAAGQGRAGAGSFDEAS
jgi:hypothetical protein